MEALGGSIRVESELGKGATFSVQFPAERTLRGYREPTAVETESESGERRVEREAPPPDSAPPSASILVIDDDRESGVALAEILCDEGYTVDVADRADHGLALLSEKGHELVLLDMMMPDVDGLDVLSRIRANPALSGTWIVALTGDVTLERIRNVERAGADGFVAKPLQIPTLLGTVRETLARRRDVVLAVSRVL